ncbi:unnamed protein product [Peronospora farinosa]|uniref:Reverse transcriptase Ty1/copia-type domain-containing protein n=1 Tax=Peronospora farinosa TaxID=134698 RepID=A0AAV0UB03_9STRA|nr:unnamed protein product [Peronospora farinosa]
MTQAMIFASVLPLTFWGDAAEYATYILNRSPTSANPKRATPIEVLTKQAPDLRKLFVFGSYCTVCCDLRKDAFAHRAQVGTIAGGSRETKVLCVYLRKDNFVVVTQHVKNIETLPTAQNAQLQRELESKDRATTSSGALEPMHATQPSKKSVTSQDEAAHSTDVVSPVFKFDPKNYREAIKITQCLNWKKAMEEELAALESNDVWTVVLRPSGSNVLRSKWVFKNETTADGEIERRKDRLVACGNEQVLGVDNFLTFAATWDVPAKHGDIPNAYVKASKKPHLEILLHILNGMDVPAVRMHELGVTSTKDLALELRLSLYGLK